MADAASAATNSANWSDEILAFLELHYYLLLTFRSRSAACEICVVSSVAIQMR